MHCPGHDGLLSPQAVNQSGFSLPLLLTDVCHPDETNKRLTHLLTLGCGLVPFLSQSGLTFCHTLIQTPSRSQEPLESQRIDLAGMLEPQVQFSKRS